METKHTPTPWRVSEKPFTYLHEHPGHRLELRSLQRFYIIRESLDGADTLATVDIPNDNTQEQAANAAFIVRAVNSHEALVEALEACLSVGLNHYQGDCAVKVFYDARAALKLAKGGQQ